MLFEQCLFHVPHDSKVIPDDVSDQFVLTRDELRSEILKLTDHFTHEIFCAEVSQDQVARAPVSRIVVDVERHESDDFEPMAAVGMGAVYMKTTNGNQLRRAMSYIERQILIERWYRPHHERLTAMVTTTLQRFGSALLIDCHSYPTRRLPYEGDIDAVRPEICVGVDPLQTSPKVQDAFVYAFEEAGFEVALNTPFGGSLVPSAYLHDKRVSSVMIEIRRDQYLIEETGERNSRFDLIASEIRQCIGSAIGVAAQSD